ncbi:MAG: PHP domain-containing protein [Candidatus Omnitrophica bacterium]|nr:PHP domain-containing protein [Candidatus Omnitrophota bacterium]
MKFADLHLHTVFSDGTYTPEGLIKRSLKAGLSAISVVDHDTVGGILSLIDIAKEEEIEILPGIELSAAYRAQEVHILGYLVDYTNPAFLKKLESLRQLRIERIHKMTAKLKGMGIDLDPKSVFDIATSGTVGRLHLARALAKEGFVNSTFEAFQKYIGDKSPAYVLGFKFTPQEAIKFIRDAGGIPVLAHPYSLHNDELIFEFIDSGLMGLEVYYPEHSQGMINLYLGIAKKHNLLVTGGSDCHGSAKPEVRIGSMKVPYELVEKLKAVKESLK